MMHNRCLLKHLLLVAVLLCCWPSAYGQVTYAAIERFSVNEGLPDATIYSVSQGENGFLWMGTPSGLIRYDGYEFELFSNAPDSRLPLVTSDAGNLFIDSKNRLWVGSWGAGLAVYDSQLALLHHFKHDKNDVSTIGSNKVQTIFEDFQGDIWVGTQSGGLARYVPERDAFVRFSHDVNDPKSVSHDRIWHFAQSSKDTLWVATSNGLNKFDLKTGLFTRFFHQSDDPDSLDHSLVRTLAFGQSTTQLWVGTEAGLGLFDTITEKFTKVGVGDIPEDRSITRFTFGPDGNLWIGTQAGLLKYSLETNQFAKLQSNNSTVLFPNDDIRDMYFDRSGLLWVVTLYAGLIKVDLEGNKIQRFNQYMDAHNQLVDIDGVRTMFRDDSGLIWIGTWTKLLFMDPVSGIIRRFEPAEGASKQHPLAITQSASGTMWIGGQLGITTIDPQRQKQIRRDDLLEGLSIKSVNSLLVDVQDTLWIGTTHNGLFKYTQGKRTFVELKTVNTRGKTISSIYQDDRQQIWVGMGASGVFQFEPNRDRAIAYTANEVVQDDLSHDQVNQIYQDSSGEIWFASKKYLDRLNPISGGFDYFGVKKGLNSNDIKSIIEDGFGDLWLGTAAGISQYNRREKRFTNYTVADGLQQNTYYPEANVLDTMGNLYFGGNQGIDKITPSKVKVNQHYPPVVLTKMWVDNKALNRYAFFQDKPLILDHQVKNIRFEFAALDFKDPGKNLYSYLLQGFDDDWYQVGGKRSASYTSLNPGRYTFKIKGSNNSGLWNPKVSEFTVIITPPVYQTWWFYLAVLLCLSTVFYLVYLNRIRSFKGRKESLQRQVEEKTAEIRILGEIGKELNASLDMEAIFMLLYQHLIRLVDGHAFAIGIVNDDTKRIDFKFTIEGNKRLPPHSESLSGNGHLSVWCISNGEEVVINQFEETGNYLTRVVDPTVGIQMESIVYLPLRDHNKNITGCMTIQSPRKNAYSPTQVDIIRSLGSYTAIALNNASAYAEVEQINREITTTQQKMLQAEKMASLGQLTAGVAHEINNPTNFVHVSAQIMVDELKTFELYIAQLLTEDVEQEIIDNFKRRFGTLFEHLGTIQDGSQRIKAIVEDLGAFTRMDEAEKQPIKIGDCINSTVHLIKSKYTEHVTFETLFQVNPVIYCHPSQLNQVFMNLLVNACDAITCDQNKNSKGLISITVSQTGEKICIVIKDNGCGMSAKTKDKLFEPFYTTKPVGKGTGLGLSISFGIINDHQGTIEILSEPGKGSIFTVTLPLGEGES